MDVEGVARLLKSERVAVMDGSLRAIGMSEKDARKLFEALRSIAGDGSVGYVTFKDFSVVFKLGNRSIAAIVPRDRINWCVAKIREL
ncbi:MAG: hypothetical protein ABWW66_04780 [Archaeoglobaceae archaeon]